MLSTAHHGHNPIASGPIQCCGNFFNYPRLYTLNLSSASSRNLIKAIANVILFYKINKTFSNSCINFNIF